jgi:hypothetical protein
MRPIYYWPVIPLILIVVGVTQDECVFLPGVLKTIDPCVAVLKNVVVANMPMYIQDSLSILELRKLLR